MMIRAWSRGRSQRSSWMSCDFGSAMQPVVGLWWVTCKKIALPLPGVRAAL
jgi:hypothetical protein